MAEIDDLNTTDASNTGRFPENMAPSAVNDGARALEGLVARWVQHASGENFNAVSETGVNSLSVSIARASFSNTATASKYIDGLSILVTVPSTVTGPVQLSINGHTKKYIVGPDLISISSSFILAGQKVLLSFDADALSGAGAWQMLSAATKANTLYASALNLGDEDLGTYDEGSWTPVVTFATPGDVSVAYTAQIGRYRRIGKLVVVAMQITTSTFTHTTASGNLRVTGLPFTSSAAINATGALYWQQINMGATYNSITARIGTGITYMEFFQTGDDNNSANVTATEHTSGTNSQLWCTMSYFMD